MKINKYSLLLICIYHLNSVLAYGQKSSENLINFNNLKKKPSIETIVFEKDQKQGHGILKYGYVFQVQSHSNQEEYGVKIIAMTTFAKLSTENKAKTKDYIIYIEKEILKIADVFIKNKDVYNKIKKSISLKKGVFNTKLNTYYLPVEDDGNDDIIEEVDVLVHHFDFYSDIITINMRYVN